MHLKIEQLVVNEDLTLLDAISKIDENAQGICFVVNNLGKLSGVITDGDIRRALLSGKQLNALIKEVMVTKFTSLPVNTSIDTIQKSFSSAVRHIPLVDEENVPVDYASLTGTRRIPVMEPQLSGNELVYVSDCIKTGWISSQGSYVRQFEKSFSEYCGCKFGIAVSNGTVAIHLALEALGIGKEDEVIVPDFTFAATINAVIYTGAKPVIADVDRVTWNISPEEIRKKITPKTKAIIPVHIYGFPCEMDEIVAIAKEHQLLIIEDCAEAIGTTYKGKHVGSFGQAATFSFFGNKTITTGEGGMVLFNDEQLADKAAVLRDHGMNKRKRYWHDVIGYNYRMTNIQAAIGLAQLEKVETFLQSKRTLASKYNEAFRKFEFIQTAPNREGSENSFWLYTIIIDPKYGINRDELIERLLKNGIETRPTFYPLHIMPPYATYANKNEYPNSKYLSENGISLPSSVGLENEAIQDIIEKVNEVLENRKMLVK